VYKANFPSREGTKGWVFDNQLISKLAY